MINLDLPKIQIYVTTRCNLKCRLCGTFCPYLKNPHDLDYDIFKKDVTRLFELVDRFERIELTGGEPLINPYLPEMIDFLRSYSNRIDDFRLLTNGRSLPSEGLLKSIEKMSASTVNFTVLLDDYGPELSINADNAFYLYKNAGAEVNRRDYHSDIMYKGGWVDFGTLLDKKHTREQILQHPEKCVNFGLDMHSMWEGVIYSCGRGIYYYSLANSPPPAFPNCVLLHDASKSEEQLRNELSQFWYGEYYEVCSYCNGKYSSDTNRFHPAEQLDVS